MRNVGAETITQAVLTSFATCTDKRTRDIMISLVQHLHAFAREVKLTEAELAEAVRFLTAAGHITDGKRQEFILLSDVLGLSMLVTAQNNDKPAGCTEATVFGPFYVSDAPELKNGDDIGSGAAGQPCFVSGRVLSLDGRPLADAQLEVWQADENGRYDVQLDSTNPSGQGILRGRGKLKTDASGRFHFRSILAESYPIPYDGPVGKLLSAVGRHPWRPAHLHFMIRAGGHEPLITHVFRDGDPYLDSDAVFGVRSSLIADWIKHDPGTAPDGTRLDTPFHTLIFDFILNPEAAK
jgi:hydroxyquinol 1,2-dioxygenase